VHGPRVIGSRTLEDFEQALDGLLRDLKTSHTGFFHEARPRSAGRIAMAATLTKADTAEDGKRWVFQDVHAGGVAAAAGIQSGDVLIAVNDEELIPPTATPFRLGESYTLTVRKRDRSTMRPTLTIPGSREKQRPIVVPDQVVSARKLDADVGYGEQPAFRAVDFVDAVTLSYGPTLPTAWELEILREHVSWITLLKVLAHARPTACAAASIADVTPVSVIH
jgi:carboxyl-terminal processing protease